MPRDIKRQKEKVGDSTFSPSVFLCYVHAADIGCNTAEKVLNLLTICFIEQQYREPARGGAICDLVPSSVQGLGKDFIDEE